MKKPKTLKEKLFQIMEEIGEMYKSKKVTLIICCEGADKIPVPMVGYKNPKVSGSVLIISAMPDVIMELLNEAWDTGTQIRTDNGSNSEQ